VLPAIFSYPAIVGLTQYGFSTHPPRPNRDPPRPRMWGAILPELGASRAVERICLTPIAIRLASIGAWMAAYSVAPR
jgi:hypothetical protein